MTVTIPGLHGLSLAEVARRSLKDFRRDDMMTYAAALSFHSFLALFPFVIFLLTLLGALGLPEFFGWLLDQARIALPSDAYIRVEDVVNQIQGKTRGGLLSFGIVAALWGASTGVRSLIHALNVAYDIEESRPTWKLYSLSVVYTIGLAVMFASAAAFMLFGPQAMTWLASQANLGDLSVTLWTWLRWPAAVLLVALAVAVIYYIAPNMDQRFHLVSPGSVLAVGSWGLVALGFSVYVSNFGNFSAAYGSLGGVIVLLLYFFLSSATLLLGAEVNAVIFKAEHGSPGRVPKEDESGSSEHGRQSRRSR